jgi:hypothetical protein
MALRDREPGIWIVDQGTDLRNTVAAALASQSDHATVQQFRQAHLWAKRFSAVDLMPAALEKPEVW